MLFWIVEARFEVFKDICPAAKLRISRKGDKPRSYTLLAIEHDILLHNLFICAVDGTSQTPY